MGATFRLSIGALLEVLGQATQRPAGFLLEGADVHEPTKAEILADVKTGLQQALAGEGRPARETLAEIRLRIAYDAVPG